MSSMVFKLLVPFFRRLQFSNWVTSRFYDLHKGPNFFRIANSTSKKWGEAILVKNFPMPAAVY